MKIFVGICNSQGSVSDYFFWSMPTINRTYQIVLGRGDHPWDVCRNNRLIHTFLKSDCDIFVKMDCDQRYPPGYFEAMVPFVEKYKVIGPLIYDRMMGSKFMPLAFKAHDYPNLSRFDITGKKGVHEIPYTHTNNFYAREVLHGLKGPPYEAFLSPNGLDRANHVDFTFLDKIKKRGFPIYCNLDVVVEHLVTVPISKEIHDIWNQ